MSNLYGLTFKLEEPTPNKPTKVINIMADEEGEKYINYLHQQLQQKENIIKDVREKINTIQFEVRSNDKKYSNLYITLKSTLQEQELLEILDKEVN